MSVKKSNGSNGAEMSDARVKALMKDPTFKEAMKLFKSDIILNNNAEQVRAQISELSAFDTISDTFMKGFGKMERSKGEMYVPVRRGWPQSNLVTNADSEEPSVIQLNKVIVDGEEVSLGSVMKRLFENYDFDGYDLHNTKRTSPMRLVDAEEKAKVTVIEDTRGVALAVLKRSNA